MVLNRLLENFLHRSRTARGINQAAIGQREDAVLAHAVVKEFGNVGGKRCGRLVAIEPGGDSQALITALRELVDDIKCGFQPAFVLERGSGRQHFQGCVQLTGRAPRHPCTQVSGLHGSWATATQHEKSFLGQPLAQHSDIAVDTFVAALSVTAHNAHATMRVMLLHEGCKRRLDAMVMQTARQRFIGAHALLAREQVVLVHARVKAVIVAPLTAGSETLIEFGGCVQCISRHAVRRLVQIGHDLLELIQSAFRNHGQ